MKTTERLNRLLLMVPWLEAHPGVSWEQVCSRFGVSEAELIRDLELLDNCSLPGEGYLDMVEIDYDGDTITVRQAQGLARPLRLTADEATALLVAGHALLEVPGAADGHLPSALAKIAAVAGAPAPPVSAPADDPVMEAIRVALAEDKRLRLAYLVRTRDEVTTRTVSPVGVEARDGSIYLQAWCHDAQGMRLFRLDNIRDVAVLDAAAQPGVHARETARTVATLQLSPRARWVAEAHDATVLTENADRSMVVELAVADPEWLVHLILTLGGEAVVLSPTDISTRVARAAEAALARS